MSSHRSIAERRRLRRRMLMALVALIGIALVLPSILASPGYAVPIWAFCFTDLAVVVVTGFFASEAYADSRTQGHGRLRLAFGTIDGLFSGWWSSGVWFDAQGGAPCPWPHSNP